MPEFKGIPLIKNIPSYNFLVGDFGEFGRDVLNEYNYTIKSDYQDNPNLKVLNLKDGVVKGSNSYSVVLMNSLLEHRGLRTVSPSDVQKVIDDNDKFLRGVYVDLGLVLKTEYGGNEYLARQLGEEASRRKYRFSNSDPLVFKPSDLELIVDKNSPCGLRFRIKDSASPFNSWELILEADDKKFNTTNKNGVPIFDRNGNRKNYTTNNGLSRLGLSSGSDLSSKSGSLVDSGENGRIVVMKEGEK